MDGTSPPPRRPKRIRDPRVLLAVGGGVLLLAAYLRYGAPPATRTLLLGGAPIRAEVVVTATDRERGLSGRERLPDGQGMLFVFPTPERYVFWMPDMRFPIDIVWIRDGVIVDIASRVPPPVPGAPLGSLPTYVPRLPADRVLEVPAGTVAATGARIGDAVKGL